MIGVGDKAEPAIPADDLTRTLTVADPDTPDLPHISVAGGAYTILVSGQQSGGRYCLIDMLVPPGGGPPPHRHDFEEMFTLLQGELAFTFRDKTSTVSSGWTINVPANAPHSFKNTSGKMARMLCMATPPGLDEFFMAVGDPIDSRTAPPPHLSQKEITERQAKTKALASQYRTELLIS